VTSMGSCIGHDPTQPTPLRAAIEVRLVSMNGACAARLQRLLRRDKPIYGDYTDMVDLARWIALVLVEHTVWIACRSIDSSPAFTTGDPPRPVPVPPASSAAASVVLLGPMDAADRVITSRGVRREGSAAHGSDVSSSSQGPLGDRPEELTPLLDAPSGRFCERSGSRTEPTVADSSPTRRPRSELCI
jgi:hypothetical protein